MDQLSLFDTAKPKPPPSDYGECYGGDPPHARGRDTSAAAAEQIRCDAKALRRRVYNYLMSRGDEGATDAEMQEALGMPGNTQRPRRRELEQVHLVVDSGRRRPTPSGKPAIVWIALDSNIPGDPMDRRP